MKTIDSKIFFLFGVFGVFLTGLLYISLKLFYVYPTAVLGIDSTIGTAYDYKIDGNSDYFSLGDSFAAIVVFSVGVRSITILSLTCSGSSSDPDIEPRVKNSL